MSATVGPIDDSEPGWDDAQEGAELISEGNPEEAVRVLSILMAAQPRNEYAYFFYGAACYELERYDQALAAYVKALALKPGYVGAMINAGHSLRMLGRNAQAIRMGKEVLVRDKNDGDALFLLGASHFALDDQAVARDYLTRFLDTRPEAEVAAEARGMLQVLEGNIVPAVSDDDPS